VRISRGNKSKVLVVLVNGGAESEEPVIALRPEEAEELDLSIDNFDLIEVELASGKTHSLVSKDKILIEQLDDQGNTLSSTYAYVIVDENLTEPLITDATIDELGIIILSFKKGLWRHVKDPLDAVRSSIPRT